MRANKLSATPAIKVAPANIDVGGRGGLGGAAPTDEFGEVVDLDTLDVLGPAFAEALRGMYTGAAQWGSDGVAREIDSTTRISGEEGLALFALAVADGTSATLEVGLAYGFSAVYLLAALAANGGGGHVAIDPYQDSDWHGIGLTTADRLVAETPVLGAGAFQLIAAHSHTALCDLERSGSSFGLTFIDGYHRFDDVLVDFTVAARMCPLGGVIVLHDMWLDSVMAVASFVRTNREDFAEIDTGCHNLFAVRRVAADERDWQHFVSFPTHPRSGPARP